VKRLEAPIVKQIILKEVKLVHPKKMVIYPVVKRISDLKLVLFMLPIALPILIIFAILIKLETSGPAFYIQERSGYKGKSFRLYKLRSMGIDAEKNGAVWAIANDPRVTKVGKFIRQTRIDELPQLFYERKHLKISSINALVRTYQTGLGIKELIATHHKFRNHRVKLLDKRFLNPISVLRLFRKRISANKKEAEYYQD